MYSTRPMDEIQSPLWFHISCYHFGMCILLLTSMLVLAPQPMTAQISKERCNVIGWATLFSAANLALAGFPLSNALGENLPSRH